MPRPCDGFADRLERLDFPGEHRAQFDSKLRSLMSDATPSITPRSAEGDEPLARLIGLMEDLARQMDVLDRRNRHISEDLRQRERRDRRRWRSMAAGASIGLALAAGGWALYQLDPPSAVSLALE